MKKPFAAFLALLTAAVFMTSCASGGSGGSGNSNATSQEVYAAIDAAFAEQYPDVGVAIPNGMDIDETTLNEKFGITTDMVEDYKGQIAMMMTNCDMMLVVKVKDGKMEEVKAALEKAKEDQAAQFEFYAVMGNPERIEASKVVENANFAALLMVGITPADPETVPEFDKDVELAETVFNETVDGGK